MGVLRRTKIRDFIEYDSSESNQFTCQELRAEVMNPDCEKSSALISLVYFRSASIKPRSDIRTKETFLKEGSTLSLLFPPNEAVSDSKMKSLQDIIQDHTQWDLDKLIPFCKDNSVNCKRQGHLVILDYNDDIPHELWNDFNRQCRGAVIDTVEKKLIAHPFDKFFNLDSHPEAMFRSLPIASGYEISTKFDGSMVTAFSYEAKVCFSTRSSFDNDQTRQAQIIYRERYRNLDSLDWERYTLIFELIKPDSGLIVEYGDTDLILIGVRDHRESKLLSYSEVSDFAKEYGVTSVNVQPIDFEDLVKIAENGNSDAVEEGWVVRFGNGLFIKVKTWQYLAVRYIGLLGLSNRQLIQKICTYGNDDWNHFLESIPEEVRESVRDFASQVENRVSEISQRIRNIYQRFEKIESQKDFAITINREGPKELVSGLFCLRSNKSLEEMIKKKHRNDLIQYFKKEVVTPDLMKDWSYRKKD